MPRLRVGDHACNFYQDHRLQWAVALPIVHHSLRNRAKCLIVTETGNERQIEKLLQVHMISAVYQRQGQLAIITPDQIYLCDGIFSTERILERWNHRVHAATAEGYKSLVVVTDMAWVSHQAVALTQLVEYEARVNDHFVNLPISSLCQLSN